MTMAYIRSYYGVPAERGMRITAEGKPGEIRGARGQYLRVLLDGDTRLSTWHPTWKIRYTHDNTPPVPLRTVHLEQ